MIRVTGPDGSTFSFPEGTDEQTINQELDRHYGQTQTPPAAPARPRATPQQAVGAGALDTASFGLADEGQGVFAGARTLRRQSADRAFGRGVPNAFVEGLRSGAAPIEALARRLSNTENDATKAARVAAEQRARDEAAMIQADRPGYYLAGQVAGGVIPGVGMAGKVAKGARIGTRMLQGAKAGGMFGAAYGAGSGTEGTRGQQAAIGGATGAIFGAATPVALKGAELAIRPILNAPGISNALNAIDDFIYTRTGPNQPAMSFGIPPQNRPPRPRGLFGGRAPQASAELARLADRNVMDADAVRGRLAEFRADPRGRVAAELFEEPGVQKLATLARMPGQTGARATRQMRARIAGQGARLERDLTGQSEVDAVEFLSQQTRDVAERMLQPVMRQPPTPMDADVLAAMARRPSVQDAIPRAQLTMEELIARGRLPPEAMNDPAQLLHYVKMEIADTVKNPLKVKAGVRNTDNANMMAAVSDITEALDQIRPGYKDAMRALSDAIAPRELAKKMDSTYGVNPNVARALLANPEVGRQLERPGLQRFGQALQEEDQLFENARRIIPATGSQSTPFALSAVDDAVTSGGPMPFSMQDLTNRAIAQVQRFAGETRRNQVGELLLTPIDGATGGLDDATVDQLIRELQRIQAMRAAQAAATAPTAGAASAGASGSFR